MHLSLVITQFNLGQRPSLCHCLSLYSANTWIIVAEYFCDGQVNCAEDARPADEDEVVCQDESFPLPLTSTSTTLP